MGFDPVPALDPEAMMPLIGVFFGLVVVGMIVTVVIRLAKGSPLGDADARARRRRPRHDDPPGIQDPHGPHGAAAFGVVAGTGAFLPDPDPGPRGHGDSGVGGFDGGGFGGSDGGFSGGDGGGSF
ncbi:hypothetical protein [Microbacterium rhizophilus]|uniref:hypothetical protein n=1 Tax=Microbacterium rhizophilus TaxID=3138934 RepID=UPI0031EACF79